MVKEVSLVDKENFYLLGLQVNDNFFNLFQLDAILNSAIDQLYGYYDDGVLCGFIHIQILYETVDIVNVVVLDKKRHKGIGNLLLNYVFNKYKGKSFLLEVDESNFPAIKLYEKNGFSLISKRLGYYRNGSNALVMKRDV